MIFGNLVERVRAGVRRIATRNRITALIRQGGPLRIEVGGGDRHGGNGWLTMDLQPQCDLYWDLRHGLPFPDASLDAVYSSHFLEHLSFQHGERFLAECLRALKPGASFSICVPDARIFLQAYVNGVELDRDLWMPFKPADNQTTRIDYVNYIAYMRGHHHYMFDEENLLARLRNAGFSEVAPRSFDPEIDNAARDRESIYATAVR
ncbi:MAG: methyltransferase domain-containing protein [Chromatiales bacterium]|nr:methyltransferase domain-containing protein [Chromatiales bacterium]